MDKQHLAALEDLVDRYGLETVLYALGDICSEKAEHLIDNWQDESAARSWAKDCLTLTRAADKVRRT